MQFRFGCLGAVLLIVLASPAHAQVTIPEEYDKLIKHRGEITAFGNEGFGDKIDIGSGGLQIVQTDVDLPGNNALPVRVTRRFVPADKYGGGHFGIWSLDIPYMHGIFANHLYNPKGWTVPGSGAARYLRCAQFSAPPELYFQTGIYTPDEYWQGSFFHLPGGGDQELLYAGTNAHVPTDGKTYPIVTKDDAAVRCVALASTSESGSQGDGFEVVTPDGVIYTLNQMVSHLTAQISKPIDDIGMLKAGASSRQSANVPPPEPNAAINFTLPRVEVFLYPTKVTDRFGNYVTYTWSATNPWQLTQITASDGRQITFNYPSGTSGLVSSVSDGTHTWTYGYSGGISTVTLPDGNSWSSSLSTLFTFENHINSGCGTDPSFIPPAPLTGSVTSPSGATAVYTMTQVQMGRSWVLLECVTDGGYPLYAREPAEYYNLAVTAKKITGPGLPVAGSQWTYAYGPANSCFYPGSSGCSVASPTTRTVSVTDPEGAVTRYTFGNHFLYDEGLLLITESGWNGTSALRKVKTTFAGLGVNEAPYAAYNGSSPRQRGDAVITGNKHPQQKVVTTQQDRDFTWEVASDCLGMPYCFDTYARPTKVVKSSAPTP